MDPKIIINDVIVGVTDKVKEWHDEFEKHIYDTLLKKLDNHVNTIYQRAADVYPDNKFGEFDTTKIRDKFLFPLIDVIKKLIDADEWIIAYVSGSDGTRYLVTNKIRIIPLPIDQIILNPNKVQTTPPALASNPNNFDMLIPAELLTFNPNKVRTRRPMIINPQEITLPESLLSYSMPSDYIILSKFIFLDDDGDNNNRTLEFSDMNLCGIELPDMYLQLIETLKKSNILNIFDVRDKYLYPNSCDLQLCSLVMFAYLTKKYYARFDEWSKIEKIGYELLETKRSDTENHELKVKADKKNIELTQKCSDMKNIIKDKNCEIEKLQQKIENLRQQILQMEIEND